MALVVENGTGLSNAESYGSVAEADTYFAARGKKDAWDNANDKEVLLRIAADYMVGIYRKRWLGYRKEVNQALDWPRVWAPVSDTIASYGPFPYYIDPATVPIIVKNAQFELAYRAMNGDIIPDLTPEDLAQRVKIGPLEIDYAAGASNVVIFRQIDMMLRPLLQYSGGAMVKVGRS